MILSCKDKAFVLLQNLFSSIFSVFCSQSTSDTNFINQFRQDARLSNCILNAHTLRTKVYSFHMLHAQHNLVENTLCMTPYISKLSKDVLCKP